MEILKHQFKEFWTLKCISWKNSIMAFVCIVSHSEVFSSKTNTSSDLKEKNNGYNMYLYINMLCIY